jgi:hypothetical protein
MAEGKKKCDPPSHGNHMHHFEEALADALDKWNGSPDQNAQVSFQTKLTPNPGGVKEYKVTISP